MVITINYLTLTNVKKILSLNKKKDVKELTRNYISFKSSSLCFIWLTGNDSIPIKVLFP